MNQYLPYFLTSTIYTSDKTKNKNSKQDTKLKWLIGVKEELGLKENSEINEFLGKLKSSIPGAPEKIKSVFFKDLALFRNRVKESSNPENSPNILLFGVTPGELKIEGLSSYFQTVYHEGANYLLSEDLSAIMTNAMNKKNQTQEL